MTKSSFLISNIKITFKCLQLAFIKASILQYFDLDYYIWIETNALGYVICSILSQLTFETNSNRVVIKTNFNQWHLIVFYFKKMISAKT